MILKNNKGFSLLEVIIAMSLLAIIAMILAAAFTGFAKINMRNEITRNNRENVVSDLDFDLGNTKEPDNTNNDYQFYEATVKMNFSETGVPNANDEEYPDSKVIMQKIYVTSDVENSSKENYMIVGTVKNID